VPRDYEQTCALARALDVIGERWTLLIVRELLVGPKRFTDLLDGLPGIPPSLLSARLKDMQAAGVIGKEILPPPAASTVYRLTAAGAELEGILLALGRWGVQFGRKPRPTDASRSGWLVPVLRGLFQPDAGVGLHETYELRLPEGPVRLAVDDRVLRVEEGPAPSPRLVLIGKQPTLTAVLTGWLAAGEAVRRGALKIQGDRKALSPFIEMFTPRDAPQPAAAGKKP
jgi:DNA-binding HxlR family transcriptional regulator